MLRILLLVAIAATFCACVDMDRSGDYWTGPSDRVNLDHVGNNPSVDATVESIREEVSSD